jgi:excisionase family DNA binding protein
LYKLLRVTARAQRSELLTIKAAAELLGVSEQTLRRWDEAGKLRARRHPMNGYRLYPREEVLAVKKRIYSEGDEAK